MEIRKEKREQHHRAQAGSNWIRVGGKWWAFKIFIMAYSWQEDILCLYSSSTYCHIPFTLKQVEGSEPDLFYKHYVQGLYFQQFCLKAILCGNVTFDHTGAAFHQRAQVSH